MQSVHQTQEQTRHPRGIGRKVKIESKSISTKVQNLPKVTHSLWCSHQLWPKDNWLIPLQWNPKSESAEMSEKNSESHFLKELMISAALPEDLDSIWTPQTPEPYITPNRYDQRRSFPQHITIRMLKIQSKNFCPSLEGAWENVTAHTKPEKHGMQYFKPWKQAWSKNIILVKVIVQNRKCQFHSKRLTVAWSCNPNKLYFSYQVRSYTGYDALCL